VPTAQAGHRGPVALALRSQGGDPRGQASLLQALGNRVGEEHQGAEDRQRPDPDPCPPARVRAHGSTVPAASAPAGAAWAAATGAGKARDKAGRYFIVKRTSPRSASSKR